MPEWSRDGRDWPNRQASRFVRAGGLPFHVQLMGTGPVLLLLHGTGAATHSWRGLMPLLARRFTVVAPDLPGHGFSGLPPSAQMSLPMVARLVAVLLGALDVSPRFVVGHSAGAAIAMRMVQDGRIAPAGLLCLNGALLPPPGPSGRLYPAAAKLLANLPVTPWIVSLQAANTDAVGRLLANTGSHIDAAGLRFYELLLARRRHVAGALRLMANWDLSGLDFAAMRLPVTLVAGAKDGMVPPEVARRVQRLLPDARVVILPGLGHLAHEEAPDTVARLIDEMADAATPSVAVPQAVTA